MGCTPLFRVRKNCNRHSPLDVDGSVNGWGGAMPHFGVNSLPPGFFSAWSWFYAWEVDLCVVVQNPVGQTAIEVRCTSGFMGRLRCNASKNRCNAPLTF